MNPNLAMYCNNRRDIQRCQTPASHRNDPISSYIAEQKMNESGIRQKQTWEVYQLVCRYPNRTSAELAKKTRRLTREQIARRLPELAPRYLTRSKTMRTCKVLNSQCVTWDPNPLPPQGKFFVKPPKREPKGKK